MPTIEERVLTLVNKVKAERSHPPAHSGFIDRDNCSFSEALCRTIETIDAERAAHAQFRQEVSAAVVALITSWSPQSITRAEIEKIVGRFILPKPVDPLVAVADEIHVHRLSLEQALAKRGLNLVEVGDAD